MKEFSISTRSRAQLVDITDRVRDAVTELGIKDGAATVFIPHTTAGITINENADPDVAADILKALENAVPWNAGYAHGEGNAAAHVKASLMGSSVRLLVQDRRLCLGAWQAVYFCEFDGPRTRKVWIS